LDFLESSNYRERSSDPDINYFAVGNAQEMAVPDFVSALQRAGDPHGKDWFAYKFSESNAQETVAGALHVELGIPIEPADTAMTPSAFAALVLVMQVLIDAGDDVIIILPPSFFY